MKASGPLFNLLTVIVLGMTAISCLCIGATFADPQIPFNPFKPQDDSIPALLPTEPTQAPSATAFTPPTAAPSWTPSAAPTQGSVIQSVRATSTPVVAATSAGPTISPTSAATATGPTDTPTVFPTPVGPTVTLTPTDIPTSTATQRPPEPTPTTGSYPGLLPSFTPPPLSDTPNPTSYPPPVAVAEQPLVVTLISDIFLAAPVEQAVRGAGYRLERIERLTDLESESEPLRTRAYTGEPLSGRGAVFVRQLAEWRPAAVIVELSSTAIPWADWIAAAKSSPATRRIPVIGFGPHTDLELREKALDAGCDLVLAKSRLLSALPELIQTYGRVVDQPGLEMECQGQLSHLAQKGIALFNERAFFEAHEELEMAWGAETRPVRELYRGILQVAVAYLHITRKNYRGAMKMFLRLRQWLDPLPDECMGVNVARLRAEALAARDEVERVGPDGMAAFDLTLLKPVQVRKAQG